MKTRLAPITRTLLLGALVLASASALAAQPAPQQAAHAQKKGNAEQTVAHQAETATAANAVAADLNATAAGVRMTAAAREADRAAGDMQLAAEAKQGYVQTAQTTFTTPDGQQVTVRSIIPIAGRN